MPWSDGAVAPGTDPNEQVRRRLAGARVAHLATVTDTDRPHVVPCCFVLRQDTIYSAVDAKPKSTLALRRLDNVRTNPQAALVVDHYDDADWTRLWWIRVEGPARVLDPEDPEARAAVVDLQAKYAQYRHHRPPGPVLAVDVERWSAWP